MRSGKQIAERVFLFILTRMCMTSCWAHHLKVAFWNCLQWPSISRLWLKRSPKENILSEDCLATLIIDNSAVVATVAGIDLHKLKRHHIFLTSAFGDESVKGCRGEKVKGRRGEVATLHLKFSKDRSKTATPFCATLKESQSRSVDLHVRLVTESLR